MGAHSQFVRGTAETLRRIANEADKNYDGALDALDDAEDRQARRIARERAEATAKFSQLRDR
jgi:hypothetical protein